MGHRSPKSLWVNGQWVEGRILVLEFVVATASCLFTPGSQSLPFWQTQSCFLGRWARGTKIIIDISYQGQSHPFWQSAPFPVLSRAWVTMYVRSSAQRYIRRTLQVGFWKKLSYLFAQLMLYEDALLGSVAVILWSMGDMPRKKKLIDENGKVKIERNEMFECAVELLHQIWNPLPPHFLSRELRKCLLFFFLT